MLIKKNIYYCLLLVSLCTPSVFSAESVIIETIIDPFFLALQNGDVKAIETFIADPLHSQVKVLLQDNQEYPAFLRNYYSNSHIEVLNVYDHSADQINVYLELYLSTNEKQMLEIQLHKSAAGDWKITKQGIISE